MWPIEYKQTGKTWKHTREMHVYLYTYVEVGIFKYIENIVMRTKSSICRKKLNQNHQHEILIRDIAHLAMVFPTVQIEGRPLLGGRAACPSNVQPCVAAKIHPTMLYAYAPKTTSVKTDGSMLKYPSNEPTLVTTYLPSNQNENI